MAFLLKSGWLDFCAIMIMISVCVRTIHIVAAIFPDEGKGLVMITLLLLLLLLY